jgi:hypothetical protein
MYWYSIFLFWNVAFLDALGMVGQAVWPVAGGSRQFVLDIHPTIAFGELCVVVITQYTACFATLLP